MQKHHFIYICLVVFLLCGCNQKQNRLDTSRLYGWEQLLNTSPESLTDSLKRLNPASLSRYNGAYYTLLDIISKDKTFYTFTSDSVINQTVKMLYSYRKEHTRTYARALMYQGIVRYRMERMDSTAYEPLKKAVELFRQITPPDNQNLCLCTQYLGLIHDKVRNVDIGYDYLKESAEYAKKINRIDYLHYNYTELGWNRLKKKDLKQTKLYIDTLQRSPLNHNEKKSLEYLLIVYYEYNKEYDKAIDLDKKNLKNIKNKDSLSLFKAYYRLSNNYKQKKEYSTSFRYALLAVSHLTDTVKHDTYLVYKNLGELADKTNNYKVGLDAYRLAYRRLATSVQKQTDTKILELERKYNYSKIENEKLERETYVLLLFVLVILLFVVILFAFFLRKVHLKNEKKEANQRKYEMDLLKIKTQKMELQNFQNKWISDLYQCITADDKKILEVLYKLESSATSRKNKQELECIENIINDYKNRWKKISHTLLDIDAFTRLSGLSTREATLLLDSEKLLLVLISLGLSNSQISIIMGSTKESIRKRSKNLQEKLQQTQHAPLKMQYPEAEI